MLLRLNNFVCFPLVVVIIWCLGSWNDSTHDPTMILHTTLDTIILIILHSILHSILSLIQQTILKKYLVLHWNLENEQMICFVLIF